MRDRLQRTHDLAVHDAGRQRVELARQHCDARLVEQREPGADVTVEQDAARARNATDRGSRAIMSRAELDRASRVLACRRRIA